MITLQHIQEAQQRMRTVVHKTPLEFSQTFSRLSNNRVYMKLENLQKTGSFKVRGSYNKIMLLSDEEKSRGVIAASAGNHAQGVAYSSNMIGIPCTIVMPKGAPLSKIQATQSYGANVILHGDVFDESLEYARKLQQETGATFVHPFDDPAVIAGQGTIGLELFGQLDDIDAVVCPVGGGGLLAGIAIAMRQKNPAIRVYGVESAACASTTAAKQHNQPIIITPSNTIADGIAVKRIGDLAFSYIQKYVDDIVCVEETDISRTMLYLLERNKLLVEGSAACSLAALLYKKIPLEGKNIVAILSGGNVDVTLISRIIERGLVESGRFVTFSTVISDKPGQLNKLLRIIADLEANVMSIDHQRMGTNVLPGQAEVRFSLETKNREHIDQIQRVLIESGYAIRRLD